MDGSKLFNVVLSGELIAGFERVIVEQSIAKLFKVSQERAALMLSGKAVTIKSSVDSATAAKYKSAVEKTGALCQIESIILEPPLEFDVPEIVQPRSIGSSPPKPTIQEYHTVSDSLLKASAAPNRGSPSERELHEIIDSLDLPEKRKELFRLMASTPIKSANGIPIFDTKDKRLLPFKNYFSNLGNGWAFVFTWMYWFAKGMWKKGMVLLGITVAVAVITEMLGSKNSMVALIPTMVVFSQMANYDLYRKLVLKEGGFWW